MEASARGVLSDSQSGSICSPFRPKFAFAVQLYTRDLCMFKIQVRKDVQGTIDYFLADKDLSDQEKRGVWIGSGVTALGLDRATPKVIPPPPLRLAHRDEHGRPLVTETDLRAILHGYAPPSAIFPGRKINSRYPKTGRRCAWDCVFSCHKSISIAALCLPQGFAAYSAATRSAYDAATGEAVEFMECLARRTNGAKRDIETHCLLAARFVHEASRWGDPQLHSHVVVMNATCKPSNAVYKRWHALETIQLYRQARELDMVFQRALAWRLRAWGLDAQLRLVDGLPVAVLPAVAPAICERLSRAHAAIQSKTDHGPVRQERSARDKRLENILNDNLRPSKKGSLAVRKQFFADSIKLSEAAQIVARLGSVVVSPPLPPELISRAEIFGQLLQASARLGYRDLSPSRLTRAALLASAARMDVPFVAYWAVARRDLGLALVEPVNESQWMDYLHAIDRYWVQEIEDTVYCQSPLAINPRREPQTARIQSLPSAVLLPAPQAQERETVPSSAESGNVLGNPQPSGPQPQGSPASPTADAAPYVLPPELGHDDYPDRPELSL